MRGRVSREVALLAAVGAASVAFDVFGLWVTGSFSGLLQHPAARYAIASPVPPRRPVSALVPPASPSPSSLDSPSGPPSPSPSPPASPAGPSPAASLKAGPAVNAQLLQDPSFENGDQGASWSASGKVITHSKVESPHSGSWYAWLDGYDQAHVDTLEQPVILPAGTRQARLSFWLFVDTEQPSGSGVKDTLVVQLLDAGGGTVLATLATYSNLDAGGGYGQRSLDLTAFGGQAVRVHLVGRQVGSRTTNFVLDDFALDVAR